MRTGRVLRVQWAMGWSRVRPITAIALLMMGSVIVLGQPAAVADAQASAWSAIQAPLPSDAGGDPDPYLGSISCGAAGSCAVVGDYFGTDFSQQHWLLETLSDGAWSAVEPPLPADAAASPTPMFVSVSCNVTGFCAAIGTYRNSSNQIEGLIEVLSDGTWSAAEAPLPADAVSGSSVGFSSVSCVSTRSCVAVGSYLSSADYGSRQGLIETLSNGVWTPTEVALPGDAAGSPSASLQRVSCAAADSCVAVGSYFSTTDSGSTQGVIETLSDGTWTPTEAPLPADAAIDPSISFSSVSCAVGGGACAATGSYSATGGGGGLIETLLNGTWTVSDAPLPGDAASTPSPDLWSVSCGGTESCTAVGGYQGADSQTHAVIETFSGDTWAATEPVQPADAASPGFADLYSVWCGAAGSCAAVGGYGASNGQEGLIETLSNGTWNAAGASLPGNAGSSPSAGLESVSCDETGSCAAVGGYYDDLGNRQGLVESGAIGAPPGVLTTTATQSAFTGEPVSDTAFLSGLTATAGGTITLTAYSDSTCSTRIFQSAPIPVSGDGTYPASGLAATFAPSAAGVYYWVASYSGDMSNPPVSEPCGSSGESTLVLPPRYLALGDSVPYGHGLANPYPTSQVGLPPTAVQQGPSASAYPVLVAAALHLQMNARPGNCTLTGDDLAISGATASPADTRPGNNECTGWPDSESVGGDELPAAQLAVSPAKLVTIQAGADDIDFGQCMEWELTKYAAFHALGTKCVQNGAVTPALAAELSNVRAALASEIEQASPDAEQIAVLNYYQVIPSRAQFQQSSIFPGGQVDPVCWGLSHNLQGARNDAVIIQSALNSAISGAVSDAIDSGVANVQLIDISNLENGHGICTGKPALFSGETMPKAQFDNDLQVMIECHVYHGKSCQITEPYAESDLTSHIWRAAHPNSYGQQDIAHAIEAQMSSYLG